MSEQEDTRPEMERQAELHMQEDPEQQEDQKTGIVAEKDPGLGSKVIGVGPVLAKLLPKERRVGPWAKEELSEKYLVTHLKTAPPQVMVTPADEGSEEIAKMTKETFCHGPDEEAGRGSLEGDGR